MDQGLEAFLVHVASRLMMGKLRIVLHHRWGLHPYTHIYIEGERQRKSERDAFSDGGSLQLDVHISLSLSIYIYIYMYICAHILWMPTWRMAALKVGLLTISWHSITSYVFPFICILFIHTIRLTASMHRPLYIEMSVALHSPLSAPCHPQARSSRGA